MRRLIAGSLFAVSAISVFAGLYGDAPDARHAWCVHDWNRPAPKKIDAQPGKPPSDAVVLFDGSSLENWVNSKGEPAAWTLVDGAMEVAPKTGEIKTKQAFGDCQLHIEWRTPTEFKGEGQARSNSGVFLMGYEVQVLDSYESRTYADGQASSVYGQNPPLVNATRAPGEWQTYDIVFHQPRWDGDKLIYPGSVTVLHNGVLTQDHWKYDGKTSHCQRAPLAKHADKMPLALQDHGNKVQFRNIWIREIPAYQANTTHGTEYVKEDDVKKLRAETAAALYAAKPAGQHNIQDILEVLAYDNYSNAFASTYTKDFTRLSEVEVKKLNGYTPEQAVAAKGEILALNKSCSVVVKAGVLSAEDPLVKAVRKVVSDNKLK